MHAYDIKFVHGYNVRGIHLNQRKPRTFILKYTRYIYRNTVCGLTFYAHRFCFCPFSSVTYPTGISIQAESVITSISCNSSICSSGIQQIFHRIVLQDTVVNWRQARANNYNNRKDIRFILVFASNIENTGCKTDMLNRWPEMCFYSIIISQPKFCTNVKSSATSKTYSGT